MRAKQELRLQEIVKAEEKAGNLLQELRKEAADQKAKAELAQHRVPFLEELAIMACRGIAGVAAVPPHMKKPSGHYYDERAYQFERQVDSWYCEKLLSELQTRGVVLIESDDEFEKAAKRAVHLFLKRTVGRPFQPSLSKWVDLKVEGIEAVHVER